MKHNIYFFVMVGFFFRFFFLQNQNISCLFENEQEKKIGDFILTWGMRSNYLYLSVLIDNTNISWKKKV